MGDEQYELSMLESTRQQLPLKDRSHRQRTSPKRWCGSWTARAPRLMTGEMLIVDSGIHIGQLPPYSSGEDY